MLEQLRSWLTWPVVRALLIATVTLFIGSALLTPHLNPATRGSVRTAESIGPVWGELVQWRVALVQASQELGHWPEDIQKYAPQIPFPKLRVTSPGPLRLQADVARGRTPLRLAVNAGNLDVAAVLAEALAAQGKLAAADVRLFKGTEYEARVAALTTSVLPKKPAKPKAPEGEAQRASWARAPSLIDGPTDWDLSQYPQWLRNCLKDVIAHLASGGDPRVPPEVLYLEYDEHFRSLRWSRTKSYLSRSGAVELEARVFDWAHMRIRFSQVEGDDWVLREAIELPMVLPGTPPGTDALCDAIGQLCAKYLNTLE